MLFLAGLESMSKEETVALIAQLDAITPPRVLNDWVQKTAVRLKDWTLGKIANGANSLSPSISAGAERLKRDWNWDPNVLQKKIDEEIRRLSALDLTTLKTESRKHLAETAKVDPGIEDTKLACAVIHRAAKSLNIDPRFYFDSVALENEVFQTFIKQLVEGLQKQLQKLDPKQTEKLEQLLRQELKKLSEADREAIRAALNLDVLSAAAMLKILKTGGGTLIAQILVGSFGFGAYLFLATTLKAVGLLFGTSFAFGTYIVANSFLAFLLSGPFMLLAVVLAGGIIYGRTAVKLDDYKAQLLIVAGRARLLANCQSQTGESEAGSSDAAPSLGAS